MCNLSPTTRKTSPPGPKNKKPPEEAMPWIKFALHPAAASFNSTPQRPIVFWRQQQIDVAIKFYKRSLRSRVSLCTCVCVCCLYVCDSAFAENISPVALITSDCVLSFLMSRYDAAETYDTAKSRLIRRYVLYSWDITRLQYHLHGFNCFRKYPWY